MLTSELNEGVFGKALGMGALAAGLAFGHTAPDNAYKHVNNVDGVCQINVDKHGKETRIGDCGSEHGTNDTHRIAHLFNGCPNNLGFVKIKAAKRGAKYSVIALSDGSKVFIDRDKNIIVSDENGKREYFGEDGLKQLNKAKDYIKHAK